MSGREVYWKKIFKFKSILLRQGHSGLRPSMSSSSPNLNQRIFCFSQSINIYLLLVSTIFKNSIKTNIHKTRKKHIKVFPCRICFSLLSQRKKKSKLYDSNSNNKKKIYKIESKKIKQKFLSHNNTFKKKKCLIKFILCKNATELFLRCFFVLWDKCKESFFFKLRIARWKRIVSLQGWNKIKKALFVLKSL